MARKTPEEAAHTRQDIINAGARVFCRDGIAGATLEAIALEAGVTRGAIYWHFDGKQGLLQALLNAQPSPVEKKATPACLNRSHPKNAHCRLAGYCAGLIAAT